MNYKSKGVDFSKKMEYKVPLTQNVIGDILGILFAHIMEK
jgi:hypothetical protein